MNVRALFPVRTMRLVLIVLAVTPAPVSWDTLALFVRRMSMNAAPLPALQAGHVLTQLAHSIVSVSLPTQGHVVTPFSPPRLLQRSLALMNPVRMAGCVYLTALCLCANVLLSTQGRPVRP